MIHLPSPNLALTLAPIARKLASIHAAVEQLRSLGVPHVILSAALPGMRPRDLDHRARRDVLALLTRNGLSAAGLDLMIPHHDFRQPATQDRAFEATLAAMELAYDLGKLPLSITLPLADMPPDMLRELVTAADARGITLAIHAEHDLDALTQFLAEHDAPSVAAAISPATLIALDHDPVDVATRLASRLALARLDDHTDTSAAAKGGRVMVGSGVLDVVAYRAALSVCTKLRAVAVELRDLTDPIAGLKQAAAQWARSGL